MNDHGTEPPDEHQPEDNLTENELIFCGMEIKQEPTVKQEQEGGDGIVTVSRTTDTANGVTLDNLIGTNDFVSFCDLVEVKTEIKIEKVKEVDNPIPRKSSGKNKTQQNNKKKRFLKKNKKQMSSGLDGAQKEKAAEIWKKLKTNQEDKKKKIFTREVNQKKHKCSLCNYATDVKTNLHQHMITHTGERPFTCNICQKRFTQKINLQMHMKTHVNEYLFSCSNCSQGLDHSEEKVKHEAGCTIRRYECHLCKDYSTLHKAHFGQHMRIHSGDRPFKCDRCSKKFTTSSNLKHHRKTHTNPPRPLKFKCSVCFKNFKQQKEKEDHEANCKRRGYKCEVCRSYTTNVKARLVNHMRIHTGEKPFRCEICSKCFTRKCHVNTHKKIHK